MPDLETRSESVDGSPGQDCVTAGIGLLLARFSDAVDGRRPNEVARLFAHDGLFQPGEKAVRGQPAIEKFYIERLSSPLRRTCHVWANVRVSRSGTSAATVMAVLTNYVYDPAVSRTELQQRIGKVTAACLRDADGTWRFLEHLYDRIFAVRLQLADAPTTNEPK